MALFGFKKIIFESLPFLLIASLISILGGNLLHTLLDKLIETPYFLLLIPSINAVSGNIGSIFSSRITSALHTGTIEPKFGRYKELNYNIIMICILCFISFFTLAVLSYIITTILNISISIKKVIIISIFLSSIFSLTIVLVSTSAAFLSFKKGLDPDNIVIPILTTVCDLVGILSIVFLVLVI